MRYDETLIKDEVFELFAWEDSQFKEFKHKILLPVAVKVAYLSASFFKNSSNSLNRIQLSQFVSLLNYLASAKKIQSVEETTRAILTFMAWQSIEYTSSYSRPNRHNHVNDLYAAIPGVTLQCASHANPNFFRLVKKLLRSNFSYGSAKKDLSAQISTIWQQTEFKRLAGEVSIRQIRYAQDDSKRCDAENSYSLGGLTTVD